tara:strand:- start:459 stop:866 length:408 start_codon:yes stop_codon:yes gene_type:complete
MKKLAIVLGLSLGMTLISCSQSKRELYEITDSFVESIPHYSIKDTEISSYGLLSGKKYSKKTTDGKYRVTPFGRLINVKILEVVEDGTVEVFKHYIKKYKYEELRDDLTDHYEDDNRVIKVYINQGGTIMVDCRI